MMCTIARDGERPIRASRRLREGLAADEAGSDSSAPGQGSSDLEGDQSARKPGCGHAAFDVSAGYNG